MNIILKKADFSAISIGKVVVLPTSISGETKSILDLYTNSNITSNSKRAYVLEWLLDKLKNNNYCNFIEVADSLYIPVFALDVKDCFNDIISKQSINAGGIPSSETDPWLAKCSVSNEGIIPDSDLNGSFISAHGVRIKILINFSCENKTYFGYSNSEKDYSEYPFCPINVLTVNNNASIGSLRSTNAIFSYPNTEGNIIQCYKPISGSNKGLWANIYPSVGGKQLIGYQGNIEETDNIVGSHTESNSKIKIFNRATGTNYTHPAAPIAIVGILNKAISKEEFNYLNNVFKEFCLLLGK